MKHVRTIDQETAARRLAFVARWYVPELRPSDVESLREHARNLEPMSITPKHETA